MQYFLQTNISFVAGIDLIHLTLQDPQKFTVAD